MKCPNCDGMGSVYNALGAFHEDCGMCHGTGQIQDRFNAADVLDVMEKIKQPQTNEEWFDSLSTEEKAEFLEYVEMNGHSVLLTQEQFYKSNGIIKNIWNIWLKAVHKE